MTLLTVPLNKELSVKIEGMVKKGFAPNKAEFARRALDYYIETQAVLTVLQAEQEVREGKILKGDLDKLAAKL